MIDKNFDVWNDLKKTLHTSVKNHKSFHEGDIWWCSVGLNVGSEQDGKNNLFERPVIVIKKINNDLAIILPLTSIVKRPSYYVHLEHGYVMLSQVRLISAKRFQRFITSVSSNDLLDIKKKFINIVFDI